MKLKNIIFILFYQLIVILSVKAQLPSSSPEYQLVFNDEFDTLYSTIVDTSKWNRIPEWNQGSNLTGDMSWCDTVNAFWDRAYMIMDKSDSSTVKVSNGTCKLLTNKVNYMGEVWNWPIADTLTLLGANGVPCYGGNWYIDGGDNLPHCFTIDTIPFKYTTGLLYSKFKFKYGYYEIKFKLPTTPTSPSTFKGFGPNFWLFGSNPPVNWWSEIDIFEIDSKNQNLGDNIYTCNIHYSNKDSSWHPSQVVFNGNLTSNVWHKASAWWTPEFVKIFYDDSLINTVQSNPLIPVDSLIPMRMIIDINSPATNFCTNFDTINTQFPYTYEIDYVRVYQLKQYCDSDKVYCNVNQSSFSSGLYKSLTIGGAGCNATFSSSSNSIGIGSNFVLLKEGFTFDNTSQGYFNVEDCYIDQSLGRLFNPQTPQSPPFSWLRKYYLKLD